MVMKKITHIEGLDAYEDHDLTQPQFNLDKVNVKFFLKSVEMPFLTEQAGRLITKNVVHINKNWELGKSEIERPVIDKVEFDEATQKWTIKKLAEDSDIRQYPEEWNAFYHGVHDNVIGTPLSILFKNDPARVAYFKSMHIESIESLARCSHNDGANLGLGGMDAIKQAKEYLARTEEFSKGIHVDSKLSEMEEANRALQAQIADLTSKLQSVLEQDLEERVARVATAKKPAAKKVAPKQEQVNG